MELSDAIKKVCSELCLSQEGLARSFMLDLHL